MWSDFCLMQKWLLPLEDTFTFSCNCACWFVQTQFTALCDHVCCPIYRCVNAIPVTQQHPLSKEESTAESAAGSSPTSMQVLMDLQGSHLLQLLLTVPMLTVWVWLMEHLENTFEHLQPEYQKIPLPYVVTVHVMAIMVTRTIICRGRLPLWIRFLCSQYTFHSNDTLWYGED